MDDFKVFYDEKEDRKKGDGSIFSLTSGRFYISVTRGNTNVRNHLLSYSLTNRSLFI